MFISTELLIEIPGYTDHCYQQDGVWYHKGIALINPTVKIHMITTDPYSDQRHIINTVVCGEIRGIGTTY